MCKPHTNVRIRVNDAHGEYAFMIECVRHLCENNPMKSRYISTGKSQPTIVAAIHLLLRPLVRLLLSHGVSFPAFCDLVRSVYVKVAEDEFKLATKPQTDSRISLLTGIHRREVNRLRNEPVLENNLSQNASMGVLLLSIWSGHPEYLDMQGMPVPLSRLTSKGGRSFEAMVQSVSKDFRARVVLDEWLRQGIVTLDDDDRVHLSADAFLQPQDMEEKAYYLGRNIHDHLSATVHNLAGDMPPFLERCVFYDKLSADSSRELADYSRTVGMRALNAVNKRAAELQKRDAGQPGAVYRTNFGVYNFSEAEAANEIPEN